MNIEKLEKLNSLKEKGILTQEEFDKQKEMLLSSSKKGVNWKNVGISALFTLLFFTLQIVIVAVIKYITQDSQSNYYQISNILPAIILTILAKKYKFSDYKNCTPAIGAFIGIMLLGPIATWAVTYQYLQVKHGNAVKK